MPGAIIHWSDKVRLATVKMWSSWFPSRELTHKAFQRLVGPTLILITIWGLFLRIYYGGVQSFWIDESFSVNAAIGIMQDGTPHLASGVSYWRGALHTYPMSLFMWLGSHTEFSARLPSMLLGTATIPVVFFIGQRVAGTAVGLAAAALIAFADIEIAWSRQARMYQQLQFFTMLSLYGYMRAFVTPSARSVLLTVLAICGAIASHILGFLIPIILGLHFVIVRLSQVRRLKDILSLSQPHYLIIGIIAFIGVYVSASAEEAVSGIGGYSVNYMIAYLRYLQIAFPLVLYLGTVGLLIWLRYRTLESVLMLLAMIVPMYLLSFHVKLLHYRYLYMVMPVLFVGLPVALSVLPELLRLSTYSWVRPTIVIIGTLLALTSGSFTLAPKINYYLDPLSPQPNFKTAYSVVSAGLQVDDVIVDSWPSIGQLYLPRPADYWPVFSLSGMDKNHCPLAEGEREIYGNALCLHSAASLKEVVDDHARGWMIVDPTAWHKLPQPTRTYISNNLTLLEYGTQFRPLADVRVYTWKSAQSAQPQQTH